MRRDVLLISFFRACCQSPEFCKRRAEFIQRAFVARMQSQQRADKR